MAEVILRSHFPRGWLPTRGFRCAECGDEVLLGDDAAHLQALARKLGLYGDEKIKVRKLLRTGGSLAVTLDRELLRDTLGDAKAGQVVRVGQVGHRIFIEAA